MILLFKYRKFRVLGKKLTLFMLRCWGEDDALWWDVEAIVPVPLHPKREKIRGFNQAGIIARELGKQKGVNVIEGCLVKKVHGPPQTRLTATERQVSLSGAFDTKEPERLKGKVVLLVDDVYTTGSTIRECSTVLKKAGAKEVRALTIAQA